jgi:cytochrome c peroxidase
VTSPHRNEDGTLTEAAQRGEKLFQSEQVGCAQCHPGPLFTNLNSFEVGTATTTDRGSASFDTPTLAEGWRSPPFLHDGSATTLKEVLTKANPKDQHGVTSKLSPDQINDLAAYLESL